MAKVERTYTIPLRKQFNKSPRYKRAKKAMSTLRAFLEKHMKSEDVRLGNSVNEEVWKHGMRNPPHHVKVTVIKDNEGVVRAELFGQKKESKKETSKKSASKEKPKAQAKGKENKAQEPKKEKAATPEEKPETKKEAQPAPSSEPKAKKA